jgi:hypothetical protein
MALLWDGVVRCAGHLGGIMAERGTEAVSFRRGEPQELPHTLAETRHLTLMLVDYDVDAGTAILELHNPEAEPNEMVAALIEENAKKVEETNQRREKLHLPEKTVPVDTSTGRVEKIRCRLHEKLQIGDRLWTVTSIAADAVTLTPGHDHEAHTWVNELEDLEYTKGIPVAGDLNTIDEAL